MYRRRNEPELPLAKTIVVLLSSAREPRNADRVSKLVCDRLRKENFDPVVVDPRKMIVPLMKQSLEEVKDRSQAPRWLKDTDNLIKAADGFVVLAPEINGTISPAFSNMMIHIPRKSFRHRPVSICAYTIYDYGGAGLSVVRALRCFLSDCGMLSLPTFLLIRAVDKVVDEEGTAEEQVTSYCDKMVKELRWYADAFKDYKGTAELPN